MNQFSAGFPRGMLMLPWGPDRWDAGQNPKDHTTMSQETMLGGNGNMHGEEDESSHHFDGIVSSLDSSPCQSGYRWCGENHHCPIAMVTRQVRTRRDKQLFQYNSEFSPSHGVESKNSKNNPSSNHPPRDEILGGFLLGLPRLTASPTHPNHHLPIGSTLRFPPTNISRDQVDDFPADSGGPTWELAPRMVVDQLGTWRVKDPTKTKTNKMCEIYAFRPVSERNFGKKHMWFAIGFL